MSIHYYLQNELLCSELEYMERRVRSRIHIIFMLSQNAFPEKEQITMTWIWSFQEMELQNNNLFLRSRVSNMFIIKREGMQQHYKCCKLQIVVIVCHPTLSGWREWKGEADGEHDGRTIDKWVPAELPSLWPNKKLPAIQHHATAARTSDASSSISIPAAGWPKSLQSG
jgi:hypothetical protein